MNNDISKLIDLPVDIPDEVIKESYDFIRKWLPVIIKMSKQELIPLVDAIQQSDNRKALALLMSKGMEIEGNKFLVKEANNLLNEWGKTADYNAEMRDFAKEGAELALKIIVGIMIAMI